MVKRPNATRSAWPTNAEAHAAMRKFQTQNLRRAIRNPNENWMAVKLATTGDRWTRQATWGMRIFDFWCHAKGIAVEVDGPEHRASIDGPRDEQNLRTSAILVLRVRNLDEDVAAIVLSTIAEPVEVSVRSAPDIYASPRSAQEAGLAPGALPRITGRI